MRVGLFTDTYLPDINGVVSSTVTLKKALERAGHTVFVITNHAGATIELEGDVLRLPGIALKGLYGYKMSSPISLGALSYIRNMNLDVIHLQTNFGVGVYGQAIGKTLGIPLVDTYHTMYEDYTHYVNPHGFSGIEKFSKEAIRAASRKVCNNVQAVISPSQKTKDILEEYGVFAPIYVCPTGLNLDAFEEGINNLQKVKAIRQSVSDDPELRFMIFLGRIAKEKSLEMVIEMLDVLEDEHFHLGIVGAGPDEDYYRDLAGKSKYSDHIHFLGRADTEDVPSFYAASDGYISASLSETQGMTYLESLATKTMVFGRRDEVLDGLIDEGITGYYFDTKEELAQKIKAYYQLNEEQKQENKAACLKKIAPFTDKTFAHKVAAVYDQAILDYSRTYVVSKIKFKDDFVQLTVFRDSEREDTKFYLPAEDYFENKISIGTKLDGYLVDLHKEKQNYYEGWMAARKRAASRDMTSAQLSRYLKKTHDLTDEDAKAITDEFESRHYIDDHAYALEKSQYWQALGYSSKEIEKKLFKAGISPSDIQEASEHLTSDLEITNAKKMAKRLVHTVKNQSAKIKRQTIKNKLLSKGYSVDAASAASEELELDDNEYEALEQCYEKALRLYRSADPAKRRQKIRLYCIKQGFSASMVDERLESGEENDF